MECDAFKLREIELWLTQGFSYTVNIEDEKIGDQYACFFQGDIGFKNIPWGLHLIFWKV